MDIGVFTRIRLSESTSSLASCILIVHFVDVRWIRVGPDGLKIDAVVFCACVGSDLDILCLALCIFDELLLLRLLGVVFCQ